MSRKAAYSAPIQTKRPPTGGGTSTARSASASNVVVPGSACPRYSQRISKPGGAAIRSEEHTSELQSLMRISYAVFCLKKKNRRITDKQEETQKQATTKT